MSKTREHDGSFAYWRVTLFSHSAIDALMQLGEGDHVACQGAMQAGLWEPGEGKPARINLSLVAETVTPLKGKPKERAPSKSSVDDGPKPIKRSRAAQAANGGGRELPQLRHYGGAAHDPQLDDDLPF